MPGRAPAQGGQPRQPFGPQLKAALVQAAPLFSAMAAGYSSGRGPYAYMDQGIAGMQAMQKQKRDEEAAAAAAAAFGGLVPGGMGPAGVSTKGGGGEPFTYTPSQPMPKANVGVMGGGKGGLGFAGLPAADTGVAQGGLGFYTPGSGDPTLGLIKQFEGFRETPYWDVNALRTGYGSDTVTMADGSVQRVGEGTRVTQADADRDLQRRVQTEFMPIAARAVGEEAFAGLAPNQKAALTSIAYNYGELPSSVAAAVRSGDPRAAAEAIAALGSHNGGVNADRRRKEAEFYLSGSTGGNVTMSAKGEGAVPSVADPLADPYVQKLMQVMAMPGLTPEQRSVVELQLQTRMGQLSAPNPDADEDRARERRARDAELLGYGRGTPEWNQYVVTGEIPAGFDQDNFTDGAPSGTMWIDPNNRAAGVKAIPGYREPVDDPLAALKARAKEGGLVEGTPEYRTFMINNGPASGMIIESTPDGGIRVVQGDAVAGAKPFTEGQSKDIVYATRAEGALASLDPIANALTSRGEVAADWLPMGLGGGMQTDEYQVAKTAGDEFLQAILRKDTGAAITTQEQALYGETYLPRPGDSPARLQYKQEARKRAVEALKGGMSPAQIIAQEKALEKAGGVVAPSSQPIVTDDGYTIRAIE